MHVEENIGQRERRWQDIFFVLKNVINSFSSTVDFHKIQRNLIPMRFLHLCQIWGKWGKRLLVREDGTVFRHLALIRVAPAETAGVRAAPEAGGHQSTTSLCRAPSQRRATSLMCGEGAPWPFSWCCTPLRLPNAEGIPGCLAVEAAFYCLLSQLYQVSEILVGLWGKPEGSAWCVTC